jgi:hypothetical protein
MKMSHLATGIFAIATLTCATSFAYDERQNFNPDLRQDGGGGYQRADQTMPPQMVHEEGGTHLYHSDPLPPGASLQVGTVTESNIAPNVRFNVAPPTQANGETVEHSIARLEQRSNELKKLLNVVESKPWKRALGETFRGLPEKTRAAYNAVQGELSTLKEALAQQQALDNESATSTDIVRQEPSSGLPQLASAPQLPAQGTSLPALPVQAGVSVDRQPASGPNTTAPNASAQHSVTAIVNRAVSSAITRAAQ